MKKFFYILILVAVSAFAITSCTEQEVKPAGTSGGATGSETKS